MTTRTQLTGVCACALAFSTLLSSQGADAHHPATLVVVWGNPQNLPASRLAVKLVSLAKTNRGLAVISPSIPRLRVSRGRAFPRRSADAPRPPAHSAPQSRGAGRNIRHDCRTRQIGRWACVRCVSHVTESPQDWGRQGRARRPAGPLRRPPWVPRSRSPGHRFGARSARFPGAGSAAEGAGRCGPRSRVPTARVPPRRDRLSGLAVPHGLGGIQLSGLRAHRAAGRPVPACPPAPEHADYPYRLSRAGLPRRRPYACRAAIPGSARAADPRRRDGFPRRRPCGC